MATVDSPVAMEVMGQVTMEVDMVVKVDGTEAMGMTLTTTGHHRVTREVCRVSSCCYIFLRRLWSEFFFLTSTLGYY